jgi:hypothetical protein
MADAVSFINISFSGCFFHHLSPQKDEKFSPKSRKFGEQMSSQQFRITLINFLVNAAAT